MSNDPFQYLHDSLSQAALANGLIYGSYIGLAFGFWKAEDVILKVWEQSDVVLRHAQMYASIRSNGNLLWDVKQYAYVQAAKRLPKFEKLVSEEAEKTSLPVATRNKIKKALEANSELFNPLRTHLRQGCAPLSIQEMKDQIAHIIESKEILDYCGKFIHRKMSFMLKGGQKFDCILSDLLLQAVYGLLRTYPQWTHATGEGHMLAIAKTNIHNRGINLIKEATAASRKSLQGDKAQGYSAVNVSLDSFDGTFSSGDALNTIGQVHATFQGSVSTEDKMSWETEVSLLMLLDSKHLKPKQRQYLKLLLGHTSEDFSAWLGQSNTEAAHKMPFSQYDERVQEYLRIPPEAAKEFLQGLRSSLN